MSKTNSLQEQIIEVDALIRHPKCDRLTKRVLEEVLKDLIDLREKETMKIVARRQQVIMFDGKIVDIGDNYVMPEKKGSVH